MQLRTKKMNSQKIVKHSLRFANRRTSTSIVAKNVCFVQRNTPLVQCRRFHCLKTTNSIFNSKANNTLHSNSNSFISRKFSTQTDKEKSFQEITEQTSNALTLLSAGQLNEALAGFDAVLSKQPTHLFAAVHRAITLHFMPNRRAESDKLWPQLVPKLNRDDALFGLVHYHWGLSQYDAQNFQDALETFDSGIERVSQSKDHDTAPLKAVHARLCDTKAKTLFALGESDKAIASWTRGIEVSDTVPDNFVSLAYFHHQHQNFTSAREFYAIALEKAPSLSLYANYATCLAALKDANELSIIFEYAIQMCENDMQLLASTAYKFGRAFAAANDITAACDAFQLAIVDPPLSLDPSQPVKPGTMITGTVEWNAAVYLSRGVAREGHRQATDADRELALEDYNKSLAIKETMEALINKSLVLADLQRTDEAKETMRSAYDLDPETAQSEFSRIVDELKKHGETENSEKSEQKAENVDKIWKARYAKANTSSHTETGVSNTD